MNEHRYKLEPYTGANTRFICPSCKKKEFARYVDTQTGNYIHSSCGRCNRESNCGYHYTPKQYFQDNNIDTFQVNKSINSKPIPPQQKPPSFIPVEAFNSSLTGYENNNFIDFLSSVFENEVATQLVSKYFIGTSKHQFKSIDFPGYLSEKGATIFWQIDITGKVRTGKIMLYNANTGKRIKQPFSHITWVHSALKLASFELKQCFFGEHLLKDKNSPVAIVESEKTAVIASVYFPQLIWLAVGSINNLTVSKCQVLKGRKVVLFPDLNGFDKWSSKAKELSHLATFSVSELLERKATEQEREQGLDIADYLLRFNYKEFTEPKPAKTTTVVDIPKEAKPVEASTGFIKTSKQLESWLPEIENLEHFIYTVKLPEAPVMLDNYRTVIDVSKYVKSHLDIVKAQNGNVRFEPYLERLRELEQYIRKHLN